MASANHTTTMIPANAVDGDPEGSAYKRNLALLIAILDAYGTDDRLERLSMMLVQTQYKIGDMNCY